MTTDNDRLARAIEEVKAKINAFGVASTGIINDMTAEVIEADAAIRQEIKTKMDAFMQSPKYLRAVEQGEQADALLAKQLAAVGMGAWTPSGTEELVELAYRLGIDTDPLTAKEIRREVVKAARELAATMTPVVEAVQTAIVQPIDPSDISRTLLAIGDDVAAKVMTVVNDENLDLEQKLTAISALDERYYAWVSPKLGELLRRTDARIRQTVWWQVTRKEWLADHRNLSDGVSDD